MQQSAKDVWKRILDEASRQLPDKVVRAWLEPTEAVALEADRLVVAAPDEFAAKWNETNHGALLSKLAESVAGKALTVTFRV
ncbi:MAG TPA: DnaA N-terminal domain-containing protein, partial [Gemmatimonadales bacterium]|nr:DnaA N-terminal domain-containing protein [Gemmatimonadales bacterium]